MADMGEFRDAVTAWAAGGPGDPARELAARLSVRTVVLLEGPSDVAAVDALAASRGRNLAAEGLCVLAMGGAMSVGRFAGLLGPSGLGLRLTGLCDERKGPSTPGAGSGPARHRTGTSSAQRTWRTSSSARWVCPG